MTTNPQASTHHDHKAVNLTATQNLPSGTWQANFLAYYWNKGIYPKTRLCKEDACLKRATGSLGFCHKHKSKWRYYNDPKERERRERVVLNARKKRSESPEWLAWRKDIEERKAQHEAGKIFAKPEISEGERHVLKRYKMAIYECKRRKINNFAWKITLDEFRGLCRKSCTYCRGVLGCVEYGKGLDRINHKKDYTIDNVLPCCRTCNRIRGDDITVTEARSMIRHLLNLRKQP